MENSFSNVNINYLCQTFENISKQQKTNSKPKTFKNNKTKVAAIIQEFDITDG